MSEAEVDESVVDDSVPLVVDESVESSAASAQPAPLRPPGASPGVVALSSGVVSAGSVVGRFGRRRFGRRDVGVAVSTADTAIAAGMSVGATSPAGGGGRPADAEHSGECRERR